MELSSHSSGTGHCNSSGQVVTQRVTGPDEAVYSYLPPYSINSIFFHPDHLRNIRHRYASTFHRYAETVTYHGCRVLPDSPTDQLLLFPLPSRLLPPLPQPPIPLLSLPSPLFHPQHPASKFHRQIHRFLFTSAGVTTDALLLPSRQSAL